MSRWHPWQEFKMRKIIMSAFWLWAGPAAAFCGTYVGGAGANLTNQTSRIAISRQGDRTTLTLANEFQGDVFDFAMVVPVPEILGEDDIRVVDPRLVEVLDGYSGPRLVKYECEDFVYDDADFDSATEAGGGEGEGENESEVVIEAEYLVGSYEIVILSATESSGLMSWLAANGYEVPAEAGDLLGQYIDSGAYFFAAKVSLESLPEDGAFLEPLQFSYTAGAFSLPIRLGTINSPGEQDLLLYILTDTSEGRVGISNYAEATLEDECMVDLSEYTEFSQYYAEVVDKAFDAADEEAAWMVEYAWAIGNCDPCSGEPPSQEQAQDLGFDGEIWDSFITRIRMRYTPQGADQDLMLYTSGMTTSDQIRFIEYNEDMEDRYPICGLGMVDEPGTCPDGAGEGGSGETDVDDGLGPVAGALQGDGHDDSWELGAIETEGGLSVGCGTPLVPTTLLAMLGMFVSGVRRRED
jgi:hypothetical protein